MHLHASHANRHASDGPRGLHSTCPCVYLCVEQPSYRHNPQPLLSLEGCVVWSIVVATEYVCRLSNRLWHFPVIRSNDQWSCAQVINECFARKVNREIGRVVVKMGETAPRYNHSLSSLRNHNLRRVGGKKCITRIPSSSCITRTATAESSDRNNHAFLSLLSSISLSQMNDLLVTVYAIIIHPYPTSSASLSLFLLLSYLPVLQPQNDNCTWMATHTNDICLHSVFYPPT